MDFNRRMLAPPEDHIITNVTLHTEKDEIYYNLDT